jgi:putative nucleotidyltransferase with HDIG domain
MAIKTAQYHQSLIEQNQALARQLKEIETLRKKEQETYYQIMRSLAQEVHAKDPYTFGHLNQVERLGIMAAKELGYDLSGKRKDVLSAALVLHDVGKIGIPDHILKKPDRLTKEEWEIMKTHVDKGAKILEPLTEFEEVAQIVRCHHENYDGTGYPRGLKGEAIPLEARIVSVVDAFHAIVSTRCYDAARPVEDAFRELERCSGTQFDPRVVEAFIRAVKKDMKKRGVGSFDEYDSVQESREKT